jgi:hypothetical protein
VTLRPCGMAAAEPAGMAGSRVRSDAEGGGGRTGGGRRVGSGLGRCGLSTFCCCNVSSLLHGKGDGDSAPLCTNNRIENKTVHPPCRGGSHC